jgi:2-polyprenyl-3-methyl-5-hydroxy-6-metoxy-1,4-benzoquinol methylase
VILCPECRRSYPGLDAPACLHCGWTLEQRDGYPIMLSRRDREDPTLRAYFDNYDEIAHDDLEASIQPAAFLQAQSARLAEIVGDVRGLDVCDVGVGQGLLVGKLLAGEAVSVTGVDIATSYLRDLQGSGARLVVANAENLPFRGEFDVVVASDILEHVLNPGDMLISVRESLRPGGRFVVRVPYRESLMGYAALAGAQYRFVHLRSFTRDLLRLTLQQAGFVVERLAFDGFLRDRVRPVIDRSERAGRAVRTFLDRRYPTDAELYRMNARLGALLLRPNTLTALTRKPMESA